MSSLQYDTIIVGQGLAGSILAWHLIHAGQRVCVLDDELASSSSKAAAGLINPLAGMRFNRPPRTKQWLHSANQFYQLLEDAFDQQFYYPLDMLRLFRSEQQKRFYQRRQEDQESRDYLGELFAAGECCEAIHDKFGGFRQYQTGYIETKPLLSELRDWLESRSSYQAGLIDYADIQIDNEHVQINSMQSQQLIFCEGFRMQQNPWFSYLPMTPDKGEILTLESDRQLATQMVNGEHWLVPLHTLRYRFGATHEHQQLDSKPTVDAKAQLQEGIKRLLKDDAGVSICNHEAGVRPSTQDRFPFIGQHPQEPRLGVFNGFGARGALTIPWYAKQFVDHLIDKHPLPAEADIHRIK